MAKWLSFGFVCFHHLLQTLSALVGCHRRLALQKERENIYKQSFIKGTISRDSAGYSRTNYITSRKKDKAWFDKYIQT
jgi:hypothetical protein